MESKWRDLSFSGNYINGKFIIPDRESYTFDKYNPADLSDLIVTVPVTFLHADEAVDKAYESFNKWGRTNQEERLKYFENLKNSLQMLSPWFVETICRELGRPLWDAKEEVETVLNDIDDLYNQYLSYTPFIKDDISSSNEPVEYYKPSGVVSLIAPFNQPLLYAFRVIVSSLITGNTIVYKPSDKTPMTGQIIAELINSAQLPAGVFNMVQGSHEVAKRLVANRKVNSVFFYGNFETSSKIRKFAQDDYSKVLLMGTGGRNAAIIANDADLDHSITECLIGAFISTGQRSNNIRRIYVHDDLKESFISKFHEKAKKISISHPHDEYSGNTPFMGPLVSEHLMENYIRLQGIGLREGAEILMRGKETKIQSSYKGYYVTPSINLTDNLNECGVYNSSEILGPNVSIKGFNDIDKLIQSHNSCAYGLGLSIFSDSYSTIDKIIDKSDVGLVYINSSTFGESVKYPIVGYGRSGNLHPEGCLNIRYLRKPVVIYKKDFLNKSSHFPYDKVKEL